MAMAAVAIRVPVVTDESREQIVLDEEFLGRISLRCCSPNRPYHLPSSCLINLTYGKRLEANHEGMDLLDSGPKEVPVSRREPCCWSQGRGYGGKEDQGCVGSLILTPRYLASILRCQTHLRGQFGRLRLKVSQALLIRRRSMKQRATHNHVHFCRGKTSGM